MNRTLTTLCALLSASVMLVSCLGDKEEEVTTYRDVAITQFTLGTLNRYTTTTSAKTGNDTVVKSTVSGSSYRMTIDQLGHQIYNSKPLPVGTDVHHVVCTISTKNGGVVALQSMTSDSLSWYNSADSIDFSQPRVFRVFAIDGSAHRDYTVALTISDSKGITFEWQQAAGGPSFGDGAWSASHSQLVSHDGALLFFATSGHDSDPTAVYRSTDGTAWQPVTTNVALPMPLGKVAPCNGRIYLLGNSGLYCSADAQTWTKVREQGDDLQMLIGAGTKELFAYGSNGADGAIISSRDGGLTWSIDDTEDENDRSGAGIDPSQTIFDCVTFNYTPIDSTDYVLLIGSTMTDPEKDAYIPWRKLSSYGGTDTGGRWVSMPVDDSNRYALPLKQLRGLACYNDVLLALCGNDGEKPVIYRSTDQGITWRTNHEYALPAIFTMTDVAGMAVMNDALWIVSPTGQTWKGSFR